MVIKTSLNMFYYQYYNQRPYGYGIPNSLLVYKNFVCNRYLKGCELWSQPE